MIVWGAAGVVVLAFVLSALAAPLARQIALRYRVLDIPSSHKSHASPTPLLGGSAIFFAVAMPAVGALAVASFWAATGVPQFLSQWATHISGAALRAPLALGILAGAAAIHILGVLDDRRGLAAWFKLAMQTLVVMILVSACRLNFPAGLHGTTGFIVTVVWLVVVINAFNFLDNMDGLCAGVACLLAAAMLGVTAGTGQMFVSAWLCLLIGAVAGFLPANFPPARQFMGDGGSLLIGYMLGVLTCLTDFAGPAAMAGPNGIFVPLVLMAVPLYDLFSVIILRLAEGRNPMIGDLRHFSHRLVRRGMSVRRSLLTNYLCAAATATSATLLTYTIGPAGVVLVLVQLAALLLIMTMLEAGGGKTR
ncbi:MAG: undecaprenyl/decaprenyl-phosphate alpha-N-acetylglucosaminyl 1-phosphate transferase [Planctomycetaceae bacterium]|nr:undecaprenyl/decaprenyl-phosphate alpha-N-acetylglucosaminyl 1-phosphate transferase [Planctomycetaceae bacterium]